MKRIGTALPEVFILEPQVFGDSRGFFLESYHAQAFAKLGITCQFVQDNHSRSEGPVLRGLHYQLGHAQAKLIRVVQGEIYDVAVDIRRGSPAFGQWAAERLSAENKRLLFIPEGFAHGFLVCSAAAEVLYKASDFYAPTEERGIIWNDPRLKIPWPLHGATPLLSAKDRAYGTLATRPAADLPVYRP
ncbi:MAG: dTDP-4-dehydrorhamnose 3,5-epimerase [Planctomycetota bacterium]